MSNELWGMLLVSGGIFWLITGVIQDCISGGWLCRLLPCHWICLGPMGASGSKYLWQCSRCGKVSLTGIKPVETDYQK